MGALEGLYGGPEVTTRPYDGYTRPGVRRHPLDMLITKNEDKENWEAKVAAERELAGPGRPVRPPPNLPFYHGNQ